MSGKDASVDIATKENLEKLEQIGERLLNKPVSRVNIETGLSEPVANGETNAEVLKKYGIKTDYNSTYIFNFPIIYLIQTYYISCFKFFIF